METRYVLTAKNTDATIVSRTIVDANDNNATQNWLDALSQKIGVVIGSQDNLISIKFFDNSSVHYQIPGCDTITIISEME